ncbi:hypothetical protein [Streptomyces sp. AC1-42T]|uniref:hypothetical protein n=1 Tax=Streptomyces sp. AC1-42T TaxID=2218665 RepID=UPI000DAB6D9A|nr:hypothetical protein [Streptomyces sp. AC1-42T]PZT71429.1 hypothetical protein DNK55_32465 [Streptomyces sp. AC1-42T]
MHATPTTTATLLRDAVHHLSQYGLNQDHAAFVGPATGHLDHGPLDVCAAIYMAATAEALPAVFRSTDPADVHLAIELIKGNRDAMTAIHAVWQGLNSKITDEDLCDGVPAVDGPDEWIDRVSYWAGTAPTSSAKPPTLLEVMGRLLRTATSLEHQTTVLAA